MIKTVTCMCPSCGATINYNKRDEFEFCTYCGAKVFFDDGVLRFESTENINYNRTDRQIDEARIKENETREKIELERITHKKENEKLNHMLALIILIIIFLPNFIFISNSCIENNKKAKQIPQEGEVRVLSSSYDLEGAFYESVVSTLQGLGFENIEVIPMGDIAFDSHSDINTIESISIAGNFKFSQYDIFKKTDKVVITYHSLKEKNESSLQ